ncbi:MAG: MmgE/PrpD family protein [Fimbriimonadales bacterium]|nr:MmgE/PrpD family protein [Fimbriimonadales bacterium]
MTELATELADYALSIEPASLAKETVLRLKLHLLDTLGCAIGAMDEPGVEAAARCVCKADEATVWRTGRRSSVADAAFANGVAVRSLDFNDTYLSMEPAHPSDNVSALMAVAEARRCSGRRLLAAMAVSYEVQCALCDAMMLRDKGWDHPTYGSISVAAGCGLLLGLSAERLRHALSIATVTSPVLRQTRAGALSAWKGCAFAHAARNGVQACLAAENGIDGPELAFEGPLGFFRIVAGREFRLDSLRRGIARRVHGCYIKRHPAEYHAQSAIEASERIVRQHGRRFHPGEIDAVLVETFSAAEQIIGGEREKWHPTTRETADHSMPYLVAHTLVLGPPTLQSYREESWRRSAVQAVMERLRVAVDPELDALYPRRGIPNRVVVRLVGGREYVERVDAPLGHALNPMSPEQVSEKFLALAAPVLGEDKAQSLRDLVLAVDEEAGLEPLFRALAEVGER